MAAVGLVALGIVAPQIATAAPALHAGDSVWIGGGIGYNGATAHAVFPERPADAPRPDQGPQSYWEAADFWAYCIEHATEANPGATAVLGDFTSTPAENYFTGIEPRTGQPSTTDPLVVQAKVMWLLTHSLPIITLDDFHQASGLTDVTTNDLVMATQYAIWRYTDLGFDAEWRAWVDEPATYANAKAAYWYLINGANADSATAPELPAPITVSVDAPPAGQMAATLIGPFVVHTNQPTVTVATESGLPLVDAGGNAIDAAAAVDGQQVYLDATNVTAAGAATITATAQGSSATGLVLSVPAGPSNIDDGFDHGQSMILAAKSTANTTGSADTTWDAVPQPQITTELTDAVDGDQALAWTGGPASDRVFYSNLTPGAEYILRGELMYESDGTATGITGTTTFTPTSASGNVIVNFVVPAGYADETLVAFERLYAQPDLDTPVAVHEDLNDQAQTIAVAPAPAIGTTLVDSADGDKVLGWNGGTVVDTIAYQNLTPGVEYTVTGELMLKSDGTATGITGTTTFTPTEANGTTTVTFVVPVGFGGEVLVAYESLFESSDLTTPVAVHQDIDDAAQTVTVQTPPATEEPAIGTSLVDSADDDHVLPAAGGTLIDTVAYQNLTVGVEYTITGELMLKGDGAATGVTGTVTFTPVTSDGSVEVTFEVPAGYAGEALVAYEELFESADLTTPVAVHQDINDAAQTVTVEQPTTTPTPTPTATSTPTPTATPTATPAPTVTATSTPSATSSSPAVPGKPGKPSGPTGLPTTGMDLSPAPFVGALALLGMGAFILIARRRATGRR